MQKDTQTSQKCFGGHIRPKPTQNRCGLCLFAYVTREDRDLNGVALIWGVTTAQRRFVGATMTISTGNQSTKERGRVHNTKACVVKLWWCGHTQIPRHSSLSK